MAPTIQLLPEEDPASLSSPALRGIAHGGSGTTRYDNLLSEEGGRFYHAVTRYRIVEVGDGTPLAEQPDFCWVTVRQVMDLLRHGHHLNIKAWSLLTCLHSLS